MKEIDDDNNNSAELKSSSVTWIFIQKTWQPCVRINHWHYQPRLGNCPEELSPRKIFLFFVFTPNDSTSEGSFAFPKSRYAQYPDVRTIW